MSLRHQGGNGPAPVLFDLWDELFPELKAHVRSFCCTATQQLLGLTCWAEYRRLAAWERIDLLKNLVEDSTPTVGRSYEETERQFQLLKWVLTGRAYHLPSRPCTPKTPYFERRLQDLLHLAFFYGHVRLVAWLKDLPDTTLGRRHDCLVCAKLALLNGNQELGYFAVRGLIRLAGLRIRGNVATLQPDLIVHYCFERLKRYWKYQEFAILAAQL